MENAEQQKRIEATVLRLVALKTDAVRAYAKRLGLPAPILCPADRMAAMKGRAVAPEACGPSMPIAPARGRLLRVEPVAMLLTAEGWVPKHGGYRGRDAARAADVFDEMDLQAARAGGGRPFTARQIAAGRTYAALVERHASVGIKGRSVETASGGGGQAGSGGIMDLILDEGRAIASMRAAIGDGWALAVVRASKRKRTALLARDLVDRVCLQGQTISTVLAACGWSACGDTRAMARDAMAAALDRMAMQVQMRD